MVSRPRLYHLRVHFQKLCIFVAPFLLLSAATAAAQEAAPEAVAEAEAEAEAEVEADPRDRARALFGEGVACVEAEDWTCAEARFREALELVDAPAVRYNLASAVFEQGRYPEADRLARQVLANPETPEQIHTHATTLRQQIQERAVRAHIVLEGAPPGAEVRVDGEAVPAAEWAEVPLSAGSHRVSVHDGDELVSERTVEAIDGEPLAVEITVVATPDEITDPGDGGGGRFDTAIFEDPIFWAIAGGSVALVVIIIIVVAVAASSGTEEPIVGDYDPGVITWQ